MTNPQYKIRVIVIVFFSFLLCESSIIAKQSLLAEDAPPQKGKSTSLTQNTLERIVWNSDPISSDTNNSWTKISADDIEWPPSYFIDGWKKTTPSGQNATIYLGFDAPSHELVEDELVRNLASSYAQDGTASLVSSHKDFFRGYNCDILVFEGHKGTGTYLENLQGNSNPEIPTRAYMLFAQLNRDIESNTYPLLNVCLFTPKEDYNILIPEMLTFVKGIRILERDSTSMKIKINEQVFSDNLSFPENPELPGKHMSLGINFSRYRNAVLDVNFNPVEWLLFHTETSLMRVKYQEESASQDSQKEFFTGKGYFVLGSLIRLFNSEVDKGASKVRFELFCGPAVRYNLIEIRGDINGYFSYSLSFRIDCLFSNKISIFTNLSPIIYGEFDNGADNLRMLMNGNYNLGLGFTFK